MVIFCDEVQAPSDFRTPLRAVAGTLAHLFGPTSAGCTAKGGVSTSTTCSVAVTSRCTNQNFCLLTGLLHLGLIYARIFGVLFKTLYACFTSRAITYMLCAIGQCWVLGFPYGATTSTRTKVACEARGHAEIREDKRKGQPPSNWKSPRGGLAVCTRGLESESL
jgi:hypothetical protein